MPSRRTLLLVDGIVNLVLGILLVLFPAWLVSALGIPAAESTFYPSLLGAVLTGIGIALLLERSRSLSPSAGLGLLGAIAINLCAVTILAGWLLFGELDLPLRGQFSLWGIALLALGLSLLELGRELEALRSSRPRS